MEGNYQPGFYAIERDQQDNRQQPSLFLPQQQQQQQHAALYPLSYHTDTNSQHQSEFVVDQSHRGFPAPSGAPMFHDSGHVLPNSSIAQQVHQQPLITLADHEVKSSTQSVIYASPSKTHVPLLGINMPQDTSPVPSEQVQSEEPRKLSPPPSHQSSASPPIPSTSAEEPQLLAALNLKKSMSLSSSPGLPLGLLFKGATQDNVEGVVAKEMIEKGVEFGPYTGTLMNEDLGWSKETSWEVCISGRVFFYVDGCKSWMSHLRCAQSEEEQNMEAFQCYGEIFFRSTKVIEPGSELRVFYSEEYKKRVGIKTGLNELSFNQDAQKFQCSLCEGMFSSAKLILRHMQCEHSLDRLDNIYPVLMWKKKKKKTVETGICCKQDLRTEYNIGNQEEPVFKCRTCKKVFHSCGRLKEHELFHEFSQDHTCPVCGRREGNAQTLAEHIMKHEPVLYKCNKCNRSYKSKAALRKHESEIHGYQCRICLERFSNKKDCKKHEHTHQAVISSHSATKIVVSASKNSIREAAPDDLKDLLGKTATYYQRPFKCRFCLKRYSLRSSVKDHEKEMHSGDLAFKCSHCPKVFGRECRLIDHLRSHEQNRMYRCTLCPRSFGSESALNNHQGEHTGLKPFKCDVCGRGFRVKKAVYEHKRRMHRERLMRFFCSVCNKGFADKGNLTKHERRHKGIRPFVCLECGKGFTAKTSLTTHIQSLHTAQKPFSCELCGKTFALNQNYTYHMFKHKEQGDENNIHQ